MTWFLFWECFWNYFFNQLLSLSLNHYPCINLCHSNSRLSLSLSLIPYSQYKFSLLLLRISLHFFIQEERLLQWVSHVKRGKKKKTVVYSNARMRKQDEEGGGLRVLQYRAGKEAKERKGERNKICSMYRKGRIQGSSLPSLKYTNRQLFKLCFVLVSILIPFSSFFLFNSTFQSLEQLTTI